MELLPILQSLVLLMLANGSPVVAKKCFGARFAMPIDAGVIFPDGQPVLGPSKTFRGVIVSVLATAACAPIVGVSVETGTLVASVAMAGDLISSFIKRRLKLPPSSQALGLDQVPESLLPLLAARHALSLTAIDIVLAVAIFFIGGILLSRLFYRVGLRDRPY